MLVAALEALDQLGLRARLIAAQLEVGDELEVVGQGGHVTVADAGTGPNPQSYHRRRAGRTLGLSPGGLVH